MDLEKGKCKPPPLNFKEEQWAFFPNVKSTPQFSRLKATPINPMGGLYMQQFGFKVTFLGKSVFRRPRIIPKCLFLTSLYEQYFNYSQTLNLKLMSSQKHFFQDVLLNFKNSFQMCRCIYHRPQFLTVFLKHLCSSTSLWSHIKIYNVKYVTDTAQPKQLISFLGITFDWSASASHIPCNTNLFQIKLCSFFRAQRLCSILH